MPAVLTMWSIWSIRDFERRTRDLSHPLALDAIVLDVRDGLAFRFVLLDEGVEGGVPLFGGGFGGFAVVLVDEAGEEVHHHDAVVFGDCAEHVVGHVAGRRW